MQSQSVRIISGSSHHIHHNDMHAITIEQGGTEKHMRYNV